MCYWGHGIVGLHTGTKLMPVVNVHGPSEQGENISDKAG